MLLFASKVILVAVGEYYLNIEFIWLSNLMMILDWSIYLPLINNSLYPLYVCDLLLQGNCLKVEDLIWTNRTEAFYFMNCKDNSN
jgi:hypothetical protein